MKLYVYCIAEGGVRVRKLPRGLFGASVRLLKIDDLAVLVSSYRGSADRIEDAMTHHQVVRSIQKQTTSLPVRFGTIVTEQQLRKFISMHRRAISANLSHVRGRAEMNVRMSGTITGNDVPEATKDEAQTVGPGTAFLLEKRSEVLREDRREQQKTTLSAWLHEKLGNLIKDERLNFVLSPTQKAFLARADHLVDREHVQTYREQMAKAIAERPEIHFMVSGPWPPYSFANIELEFKSHFGVS
jgi:hypothetical protein